MKSQLKKVLFIAALFVTLSSATGIHAQDKISDSLKLTFGKYKPELNDHFFITSSLVEGPFTNTFFRLDAGLGNSTNYDVPPLVIRGQEISGLFGHLTYVTLNIRYQQKIKEWLAFSFGMNMKGSLGSQTISIISEGIDLGTSLSFAWAFKFLQSRKLMLASTLGISSIAVTIFNISDFINKIVESGTVTPDNKLVKTTNITAGTAGLRAAYAFNPTFGLIGKVDFGYGESISGANKGYFDGGISFDADLNPKLSFPIGFALGYSWNNYSQSDLNVTDPQNIIFKINYTGKKDFDLGVELNTQFYKLNRLDQDINMSVLFVKAGIAYYF